MATGDMTRSMDKMLHDDLQPGQIQRPLLHVPIGQTMVNELHLLLRIADVLERNVVTAIFGLSVLRNARSLGGAAIKRDQGVICVDHALMCTVAMYLGRGPIRVRLAHSLKANNDSGRSLSFFFVLFCVCISSTPNSKPWQTFNKS